MSNPNPAKVRLPNSVHLTQKDMVASLAFYRDRLGFQVDACWPDEKNPMFSSLNHDGQVIMLGGSMDPDKAAAHVTDPDARRAYQAQAKDWSTNKAGVGVTYFVMVKDVDA